MLWDRLPGIAQDLPPKGPSRLVSAHWLRINVKVKQMSCLLYQELLRAGIKSHSHDFRLCWHTVGTYYMLFA